MISTNPNNKPKGIIGLKNNANENTKKFNAAKLAK